MKHIAVVLFALFCISAKGQTYMPFPTGTAYWTLQHFSDQHQPDHYFIIYKMDGDTVINTTPYNKLYTLQPMQYVGGLREDNKVIYYYPADSVQEYTLYDFNALAGDTIFNAYNPLNPYTNTSFIDTLIVGGTDNYGHQFVENTTIYQGIGSINGPVTPVYGGLVSGWYYLTCFMSDDTTASMETGECLTALEENPTIETLEIFPNPTTDFISIKSNKTITSITLFNLNGSRVFYQVDNGLQNTISTQNLPAGMYILAVGIGNEIVRKKIIIVR